MFKRLRERLEAALAAATPSEHPREAVGRMRAALIEMRAAVEPMRRALEESERLRGRAQAELETADRRRGQAAQIGDQETVSIAEKYAAKLKERLGVLEQKIAAQRAELTLAEQDLAEATTQLTEAAKLQGADVAQDSADAAWRELGRAGMDRPDLDVEQEALRHRMDRARIEAEANAKLDELKRRMGKS